MNHTKSCKGCDHKRKGNAVSKALRRFCESVDNFYFERFVMFGIHPSRFALLAVLGSVALGACSTQTANSRYGAEYGGYESVATYESSRYAPEGCDTGYSNCGYVQPDPCCVPCCTPAPTPVYMPPPPPPVYIPEPEPEPEPPVYVPPAPQPEPEPPVYTPPPSYPPAPEPEPYLPPRK